MTNRCRLQRQRRHVVRPGDPDWGYVRPAMRPGRHPQYCPLQYLRRRYNDETLALKRSARRYLTASTSHDQALRESAVEDHQRAVANRWLVLDEWLHWWNASRVARVTGLPTGDIATLAQCHDHDPYFAIRFDPDAYGGCWVDDVTYDGLLDPFRLSADGALHCTCCPESPLIAP